jgi:hypothetical protein
MKKRTTPLQIANATTGVTPSEAKAALCNAAITENTLLQYTSRIRQLTLFLKEKKLNALTLDNFALFLEGKRNLEGTATGTAEGYRSAILHFQNAYHLWTDGQDGQSAWAASDTCIKMCRGFKYNSKKGPQKRPRGAVDSSMFDQYIEWIGNNYPSLVDASYVAYGVGLRLHAIIALHHGSYEPTTQIVTYNSKAANAKNMKPLQESVLVIHAEAQEILSEREKNTREEQLYFPRTEWTSEMWRKAMKQCATDLEWPKTLKFDGPHTLRHGAVQHLVNATTTTLNLSKDMRRHYGRTNAERINKASSK